MFINSLIDQVKTKLSGVKLTAQGKEKVLVICDLHIPFHREKEIIDIIMKHRHEVSTIIFGGDIIDCESVSKFSAEIRKPLIEEMTMAYKLLSRIDKLTPNIKKILIWGNHEHRFVRYLSDNRTEMNPFHSTNVLYNIISGFTHHDRTEKKKITYPPLSDNFVIVDKWYVVYNDIVVAHPKNFSKIQLRTAVNTVEYFLKKGFKINGCLIGHTHKWGETVHYNVWTVETGCTCLTMEYAESGNTSYSPQDYGYAVVAFENGMMKQEESRLYRIPILEEGDYEWQEIKFEQSDQN